MLDETCARSRESVTESRESRLSRCWCETSRHEEVTPNCPIRISTYYSTSPSKASDILPLYVHRWDTTIIIPRYCNYTSVWIAHDNVHKQCCTAIAGISRGWGRIGARRIWPGNEPWPHRDFCSTTFLFIGTLCELYLSHISRTRGLCRCDRNVSMDKSPLDPPDSYES